MVSTHSGQSEQVPTAGETAQDSTPQSLQASESSRPQAERRRGPAPQISRELAIELVRCRSSEGLTIEDDDVGTYTKERRTLEEFARDMVKEGVTPWPLHRALLSRLFTGRMYPDLEVDGKPVEWSKLPRRGRRGRKTSSMGGELLSSGRTFRDALQSLERAVRALQGQVEALGRELDELREEVRK